MDGLSEGNAYVIHQDKKGFIWVGTNGGLNRYDGYGFRTFQCTPFNPSSLGDNAVFFLKEDSTTDKFWIGGSSCLNEFDPANFSNTRYMNQRFLFIQYFLCEYEWTKAILKQSFIHFKILRLKTCFIFSCLTKSRTHLNLYAVVGMREFAGSGLKKSRRLKPFHLGSLFFGGIFMAKDPGLNPKAAAAVLVFLINDLLCI
jgi:Two component regulator propeller